MGKLVFTVSESIEELKSNYKKNEEAIEVFKKLTYRVK